MTLNLKIPAQEELRPKITVFGVGGAGGNAVNNMIEKQLDGCEFVVANTDAQALASSAAASTAAEWREGIRGLGRMRTTPAHGSWKLGAILSAADVAAL